MNNSYALIPLKGNDNWLIWLHVSIPSHLFSKSNYLSWFITVARARTDTVSSANMGWTSAGSASGSTQMTLASRRWVLRYSPFPEQYLTPSFSFAARLDVADGGGAWPGRVWISSKPFRGVALLCKQPQLCKRFSLLIQKWLGGINFNLLPSKVYYLNGAAGFAPGVNNVCWLCGLGWWAFTPRGNSDLVPHRMQEFK